MNSSIRRRFLGGLALLAVLAGVFCIGVLPRLRVETDLLALLPPQAADAEVELALEQFSARLSRKVLFLVGAQDDATAREAARAFAAVLGKSDAFAVVQGEVGQDLEAVKRLYLAHRAYLLSRRSEERLAAGRAGDLYLDARRDLYTPAGLMRPIDVVRDPLGLGSEYLLEQLPSLGNARLDGSRLVVSGDRATYVVIAAETAGSPFSVDVQDRAEKAIDAAFAAARSTEGAAVRLLQSGALQHATAATSDARAEVSLFGSIATVGVLALMLLLFRSWRAPALGIVALAAGAAAGITATHFLFGQLHLIALVFGSSLIGVAIDYSMHFFSDQFRDPERWSPTDALAHVGRPILLGLSATLLGYAGLLLLPFPGLRQMAVISLAGLSTACACVFLLYPALARGSGRPLPAWCAAFLAGTDRLALRLATARVRFTLAFIALVIVAIGFSRMEFHDDIRSLQPSYPDLLEHERQVRELLGTSNESRFFLVTGASPEAVLQTEERLAEHLRRLVRSGAVASYSAVSDSLPSRGRQARVRELLARHVYAPQGVLPRLMREIGFDEDAIRAELAAFERAAAPLEPDEWLANPVSTAYRHQWLGDLGGRAASIVTLGRVRDARALRALAQSIPGIRFIDRVAEISDVLASYRAAVLKLLTGAYVVIFLALAFRYGTRGACWMIGAPLGATALTLAFAGIWGQPVTLFVALALLLLLALGVDYAIFLREARAEHRTALLAVSLSAFTTMLSFGLLTLSSTPLIRAIGWTLFVGIGCCWLIAVFGDAWRRGGTA